MSDTNLDYTVLFERIAWALETIANAVNEDPARSINVRIVPSAHPEAPVLPLQDQPIKELLESLRDLYFLCQPDSSLEDIQYRQAHKDEMLERARTLIEGC